MTPRLQRETAQNPEDFNRTRAGKKLSLRFIKMPKRVSVLQKCGKCVDENIHGKNGLNENVNVTIQRIGMHKIRLRGKVCAAMKRFNRNTTYNSGTNIVIHIRLTFGARSCHRTVEKTCLHPFRAYCNSDTCFTWRYDICYIKICCHKMNRFFFFFLTVVLTNTFRFTKLKKVLEHFQFGRFHGFICEPHFGLSFVCFSFRMEKK